MRQFIYQGLNVKNSDRCFVQHNKILSEIYFCYQSGDSLCSFTNTERCNRAAIYNYKNDTWSLMDLPNVSAGTTANVDTVTTYATVTETYDSIGGSFLDQKIALIRHTMMVGGSDKQWHFLRQTLCPRPCRQGSSVAFDVDTEATKPPFLERVGLDLR